MLAAAALFYAWVLSRGSFDPFGPEPFGLLFNSMLDHMLRGRWDVDPASIGFEAFVHDGRSYAYFGPFPALLRLPLLLWPDGRTLHVERLSCWLAIMLGIAAQTSALTTTLARIGDPTRRRSTPPLVILCAFSGTPMLLAWKGALIYHEAILWAWALATIFVALALPALQRPGPIGSRRLSALALCAGLCLLTRSTTGAGLYLATGLLLVFEWLRHGGIRTRLWTPATVLAAFIVLTGIVNQGRWGSPIVFANMTMQPVMAATYPDRLIRLQHYALFDWHRLGTGLLYYVVPVWTEGLERMLPLTARLSDFYDALEQPASSLLLTDPAWCLLSLLGMIAIARRRASLGDALLASGLMLAPILMLIAWSLTFRYRAEFAPLLLALSCIALRAPAPIPTRLGLSALCILQIGGAAMAGWLYALQPFGPSPGYSAISLRCTLQPASCLPPKSSPGGGGWESNPPPA